VNFNYFILNVYIIKLHNILIAELAKEPHFLAPKPKDFTFKGWFLVFHIQLISSISYCSLGSKHSSCPFHAYTVEHTDNDGFHHFQSLTTILDFKIYFLGLWEIIITVWETMPHLLKRSLTKELFGTEKYRAVNWITQIMVIISLCDCIRVIYFKKKKSSLKFSFNCVIAGIVLSQNCETRS
jgi:hypothetical protein